MAGIQRRDELFARSLSCGNDFVEALITAQIIPAWIEAEIAVELQYARRVRYSVGVREATRSISVWPLPRVFTFSLIDGPVTVGNF